MMKRIVAVLTVCAVFAMVGMQFVFASPALNQSAMVLSQVSVAGSEAEVSQNGGEEEGLVSLDENMPDWFIISAEALGLDEDGLFAELEAGKSIAQIAEEKAVDVQGITDAIVAAETAYVNELVSSGEMTQAEADEWLAELSEDVAGFLNSTGEEWESCEFGEFEEGVEDGADWIAITTQKLGMDEDALFKALEEGKTIAQLAEEKGVDAQSIVDEIMAEESKLLNELVSSGEITQAEADEWLGEMTDGSSFFLNESLADWEGPNWEAISAQALGMDEDALFTELDAGKSIAELAQERGVDVQTIADALIAADTEYINKLVADGQITQAEADEWLAELAEEVNGFLNESFAGGEDGGEFEECGEFMDGPDWLTISAEALTLDETTLFNELDAGKTIAQIAQERGVDTQVIVDRITAKETEFLTQLVNDGEMTQAEADEWLAELATDINEFLNESWSE